MTCHIVLSVSPHPRHELLHAMARQTSDSGIEPDAKVTEVLLADSQQGCYLLGT